MDVTSEQGLEKGLATFLSQSWNQLGFCYVQSNYFKRDYVYSHTVIFKHLSPASQLQPQKLTF